MATIPVQATGSRHVRKTIAFTGGANNGALGDTVPAFTLTGVVLIEQLLLRCTESLVCAAPTLTRMYPMVGTVDYISLSSISVAAAMADRIWDNNTGSWAKMGAFGGLDFGYDFPAFAVAADIGLSVEDGGGGAAITDGTLVIDCWYRPVTDDGALAGDDIDLELGAYLADKVLDEALSGHTTAGSLGKAVADVEVDTSTTLQAELDGIQADTEDIQTRLPAALVGGRIDATIDATGMEAGAIDAILTRQLTEAYAADGAAPTLAQALFEIMQCLTEFAISGTTITVKKRDGSTTAMTFTLDSATKPTSRTRAT